MAKPFAVFDIDGTIFRSSLLIEVVEALIAKGVFPANADTEIKRAQLDWQERDNPDSYRNYLEEVIIAFQDHIKGVTEAQLELVSEDVIKSKYKQTYVYTRELINSLKKTHVLLAISGSPYQLVKRFAHVYGFKDFVASIYLSEDGVFNGNSKKAVNKKDVLLADLVEKHGLYYEDSIAVGDTSGDIDLLNAVKNPIAFNPDAKLLETATSRGWKIVVERKSQIYEMESDDGTYVLA